MADTVQKSNDAVKSPEKVEKPVAEVVKDGVQNGSSAKDEDKPEKDLEEVKESASEDEESVENGDVKENGAKDSESAGDVCGLKRKSDVSADTTDVIEKPEKKKKLEDDGVDTAAATEVASNGDAEAKA